VLDTNHDTDSALAWLKQGQHGIARRVLQKPNQPRRAQDLRHPIMSKVDYVLLVDHELLFTEGARSCDTSHVSTYLHRVFLTSK
jgi:hypothetical protein